MAPNRRDMDEEGETTHDEAANLSSPVIVVASFAAVGNFRGEAYGFVDRVEQL